MYSKMIDAMVKTEHRTGVQNFKKSLRMCLNIELWIHAIVRGHIMLTVILDMYLHWMHGSVHSGRVANALDSNAGDDGFAPLRRYFRDLFLEPMRSLAQRDVEWLVWHCRNHIIIYFVFRSYTDRLKLLNRIHCAIMTSLLHQFWIKSAYATDDVIYGLYFHFLKWVSKRVELDSAPYAAGVRYS